MGGERVEYKILPGVKHNTFENIRIYHVFVERLDKSVPMFAFWHHEPPPTYLSIFSSESCWILFLAYFWVPALE